MALSLRPLKRCLKSSSCSVPHQTASLNWPCCSLQRCRPGLWAASLRRHYLWGLLVTELIKVYYSLAWRMWRSLVVVNSKSRPEHLPGSERMTLNCKAQLSGRAVFPASAGGSVGKSSVKLHFSTHTSLFVPVVTDGRSVSEALPPCKHADPTM